MKTKIALWVLSITLAALLGSLTWFIANNTHLSGYVQITVPLGAEDRPVELASIMPESMIPPLPTPKHKPRVP